MWACVAAALLAAAAGAEDGLTVVRLTLSFEEVHTVVVNQSVEYVLDFVPRGDQGQFPSRLWVRSDGGDTARPVLLVARQIAGAQSWQLPYKSSSGRLLYELERTLCPDHGAGIVAFDGDPCGSVGVAGAVRVSVGSACAADVRVQLRAAAVRDWRLPFHQTATFQATEMSPSLRYYEFSPEQESVRLALASRDDVCATLSIQNFTCPIPEFESEIGLLGMRMTVQQTGAVFIRRGQFPRGFVAVVTVHGTDGACAGAGAGADDAAWLWEAALGGGDDEPARAATRVKTFSLTVEPSLSRGAYAVACSVTLALFLSFYVAAGALVLARRYAPWARLVAPRAVLATETAGTTQVDADTRPVDNGQEIGNGVDSQSAAASPRQRHRRLSTSTYDSSDMSDSESDVESPPTQSTRVTDTQDVAATQVTRDSQTPATQTDAATTNTADVSGTPFGLPARLNVAALARRRGRTLGARSDRYLQTLYTVAVFYMLPVVQFVFAFHVVMNISGSLDLCYFNFLCAHPAGALSDFNHVFSNTGYLLLGGLFVLQVQRRRTYRKKKPKHEEYGIPAHYGMLQAMGAGMMVVALLSASYHVCPNQLNFQFDTSFMYVLAVLSMVKIYQSRHPDINARAHATFGVLAVLIALVVWGVLGGGALFWGLFTVLHVFTFLLLSLRIYYVGQFRLDKQSLVETRRGCAGLRPLYSARLVLLAIANAVNWLFALYGLFAMPADFAGHMLFVLLANTLLHMMFYLAMKLLHGERLRWYAWLHLSVAACAWAPAMYFFTYGASDWSATPAQSRHNNHHCKVLEFYDSHDLWHMLSAVALYFSFNGMLTWDDGLSAVKRTEIAVF